MRLFFGFQLSPDTARAIADWRTRALPQIGKIVPQHNFHVTLVFLGSVSPSQLEDLIQKADQLTPQPINLTLDTLGYFPGARALWIGPSKIPAALVELQAALEDSAREVGLETDKRPYTPHVTLFRKCKARPPESGLQLSLSLSFSGFSLFHSISTDQGVEYVPIHAWP